MTLEAGDVFSVAPVGDLVRLAVKTPGSDIELDMPRFSAVWLACDLLKAADLPGAATLAAQLEILRGREAAGAS